MSNHISRARQVFVEDGPVQLIRGVGGYLRWRGRVLRRKFRTYRLRRREGNIVERQVNGYLMVLDLRKGGICSSIALNGVYGPRATEAFAAQLEELRANYDLIKALDIGANIGYFALLEAHLLDTDGDIVAFEPSPDNVAMLEANIQKNNFEDRIDVRQCAVGATPGEGELSLASVPNSHFMSDVDKPRSPVNSITVDVTTVDVILDEEDIDDDIPVIVRMDVEGYEHHVFKGMGQLLQSDRPALVMVELHPVLSDDETGEIFSLLRSTGFELVFADDDSTSFESIDVPIGTTVNFIAKRE